MKETVKMFFGFSRTVEREERGAVGGRNIQSGDINAEILDNKATTLPITSVPQGSVSTSTPVAECVHHFEAIASSIEQTVLSQSDQFSTDQDKECPAQCFHGSDESCESRHRHKCFNLYYTVNNYYSCSHENETCRKLSSTAATSRIEEHACNASTMNTTPVTCSKTSESSSFLMASLAEGAATAPFTHRDDTTLLDTAVDISSETVVTPLETTGRSSIMTSSPQQTTTSVSPQTSQLESASLSVPITVTTLPLITVPVPLPSTHTATALPPTPPTAVTMSPSSAPVVLTSTSAASPDLAETLAKFTEQLTTALQSTRGENQRSSTLTVNTSGSGNTPLFQVYNVNINPTTTNVHEAGTVAIGSNIQNVERRETKKRNDENDSEGDRKSLDSDHNENSASDL